MKAACVVMGLALMLAGTPVEGQSVPAVQPPSPPAAPAAAMPPVPPAAPGAVGREHIVDAGDVRAELGEIVGQYPPALRQVLRLSPSLATNADYMRPYPVLAGFLAAHPEIHQNPTFYFGSPQSRDEAPGAQRARVVSDMLEGLGAFFGLMSFLAAVAWFSRSLLEHQRWKRALKIQADAHAKLVERLSSTEDVLAYAQTPAGRQFLESGAPIEPARPGLTAPIARILWAVQVGTVVAVLGVGLMICARIMGGDADLGDVATFARMMGIIGLAIGLGFIASAGLSYLLSQRLGLLHAAETQHG